MNKLYNDADPKSIEAYGKKMIGRTFRELSLADDCVRESEVAYMANHEDKKRKGGLGELIEERHFGYKANNDQQPDFPNAGVELKVTPYKKNKNGALSAKERLIITMIDYMEVIKEQFETSHVREKSRLILLMYYLFEEQLNRLDYHVDYVQLFTPPAEDLEIMKRDFEIIKGKVEAGLAHELSEADTLYLGAATKASTSQDRRQQPKCSIPAKPRAFSFKQSYMTYVLNNYIVPGVDTYQAPEEPLFTEVEIREAGLSESLKKRLSAYAEMYENEIAEKLGVQLKKTAKNYEAALVYKMLGVKSNRIEEFEKAGILVKIVRFCKVKSKNQQFRLEDFKFMDLDGELFDDDILDEETSEPIGWQYSDLYDILANRKYFFVVFWEDEKGSKYKGCQLWGMPDNDIEAVHEVWKELKQIVRDGVKLEIVPSGKSFVVSNNLPGIAHNGIFHVRPHAARSFYRFKDGTTFGAGKITDSDVLPNGERMTKQAYWLNRSYIENQLSEELRMQY